MKKIDLLTLFLIALCVLSINFVFQKHPGYMDSEYYFLGGRQLLEGENSLPVIWNYLDGANQLPHPLFSYWMPFASILTAVSMFLFGSSFLGSRIIFYLLAAGLAPLTFLISYKISQNRFISYLSGLLSIFSGYYLKFFTIPETIVPVIFLGGIFFLLIGYLFENKNIKYNLLIFLGIISGLLYLSRSDGVLYVIIAIGCVIVASWKTQNENEFSRLVKKLLVLVVFFLITTGLIFVYNKINFGTFLTPASSRALMIATYDDTFIYPASALTPDYFFEQGVGLRPEQIWTALKQNTGSFIGVQLLIVGLPLFILGLRKRHNKSIIRVAILHFLSITVFMTIVFPLAGARGGFLHASSGNQIILWFLVADGLHEFIEWGIRKRNWKLVRSQKMFGSALVIFVLLLTVIVYAKDVVGDIPGAYKWNSDYEKYEFIESMIKEKSEFKSDVVMINNPLGYYYTTGRWSVVIPNAESLNLLKIMNKLDVKYVVLDENMPDKFGKSQLELIEGQFNILYSDQENLKVYARP